ncbi:MAG: ATP synthase subunit c [Planctomycetes bacterium]|nr:ATP synthase subunit c [Planctomycetota bacterium]
MEWAFVGAAMGAAIAAVAAAMGIGKISAAACESIARQPEAAADIKGNTVLTAAFIEGVCLFACVIALLTSFGVTDVAKIEAQAKVDAAKAGK